MKNRKTWRLTIIATVVFLLAAGVYFVIIPVQESKKLEQEINDRFGWLTDYTPPLDGHLTPGRVEAFIQVREAVQRNCRIFQGILEDIIAVESVEADEKMTAGEKASKGMDSFKSMFSAAPAFLEFMDARNAALLEVGMGLGEYVYIYLASYGPQLSRETGSVYADMDEAYLSQRARSEFAMILENQVAALTAAGQESSNPDLISDLRMQIANMEKASKAPPWPNGPGGTLGESLAPFREQIDALYCSGIVKTELLQKNRGLNFGG
jgi:hypothetical protein